MTIQGQYKYLRSPQKSHKELLAETRKSLTRPRTIGVSISLQLWSCVLKMNRTASELSKKATSSPTTAQRSPVFAPSNKSSCVILLPASSCDHESNRRSNLKITGPGAELGKPGFSRHSLVSEADEAMQQLLHTLEQQQQHSSVCYSLRETRMFGHLE